MIPSGTYSLKFATTANGTIANGKDVILYLPADNAYVWRSGGHAEVREALKRFIRD